MAQALFKSWFVDFDPVIDNALAADNAIPEVFVERAKQRAAAKKTDHQSDSTSAINDASNYQHLFPAEFEFTEEMGWIPLGWGVGVLSDIAKHVKANAKKEDIADDELYIGLEHIGRKKIFLNDFGLGEEVNSNKSCFEKSDILFGKLRPYFHKVCIAPFEGVCSTDILVFRAKNENERSYLTMLLFTDDLVEFANLRSTGTRMPRANAKDILAYPSICAPKILTSVFESLVSGLFSKGLKAQFENIELSKLRDTLLPKLLSGELRIPDAEKLAQEALL